MLNWLDEDLIDLARATALRLKPEARGELQELLDRYLNAIFLANGPVISRRDQWRSHARDRLRLLKERLDVEVALLRGVK